jgi:hypothetical protein
MVDECLTFGGKEILDVSGGRDGYLGKVQLVVGPFQSLAVLSGLHGIDALFVGEFDGLVLVAAEVDEDLLFLPDES